MARFHSLEVTDVRRETRDAVVVTLKPQAEDRALFDFTQGQYLTFRRQFDGIELRRSYSICAGKDEGVLKVGIKRVEGGAFSTWANEHLTVGALIDYLRDNPELTTEFWEVFIVDASHHPVGWIQRQSEVEQADVVESVLNHPIHHLLNTGA